MAPLSFSSVAAPSTLLVLALWTVLAPLGGNAMPVGSCGTETPSRSHQLLDQARMLDLKERSGLSANRKLLGESCEELARICDQCINIPTYVHFIVAPEPDSELGYILPHPDDAFNDLLFGNLTGLENFTTPAMMLAMVEENIDLTNRVFQYTPFRFTLMTDELTVTPDLNWTLSGYEDHRQEMTEALGQGGLKSLNIYLLKDILEGAFGVATFPSYQGADGGDGIWMIYSTVTDGGAFNNDLGYTLPHEIGHWLGLYHTFESSSVGLDGDPCSDDNTNDFVDDTGIQFGPSQDNYTDCTEFLFTDEADLPDTCPGQPLIDPFFNIMNYLDNEDCFEAAGFANLLTCGQIQRMWLQWFLYRDVVTGSCNETEMLVNIAFEFDSYYSDETSFYLSNVGSADPIFNSTTDFDDYAAVLFYNQSSLVVDLCLPRGEDYEFVIQDSLGDGTNPVNPVSIVIDGILECTLPGDFGSEARVLFNETSLDCNA